MKVFKICLVILLGKNMQPYERVTYEGYVAQKGGCSVFHGYVEIKDTPMKNSVRYIKGYLNRDGSIQMVQCAGDQITPPIVSCFLKEKEMGVWSMYELLAPFSEAVQRGRASIQIEETFEENAASIRQKYLEFEKRASRNEKSAIDFLDELKKDFKNLYPYATSNIDA